MVKNLIFFSLIFFLLLLSNPALSQNKAPLNEVNREKDSKSEKTYINNVNGNRNVVINGNKFVSVRKTTVVKKVTNRYVDSSTKNYNLVLIDTNSLPTFHSSISWLSETSEKGKFVVQNPYAPKDSLFCTKIRFNYLNRQQADRIIFSFSVLAGVRFVDVNYPQESLSTLDKIYIENRSIILKNPKNGIVEVSVFSNYENASYVNLLQVSIDSNKFRF